MSMVGGAKLIAALDDIADKTSGPSELRVGFLEDARYPDGTLVAQIAAMNEFGGTIQRQPSQVTIYRKVNAAGFLKSGRFVKRKNSNFATTHAVGAYTITIPPRPFFRTMISQSSPGWGADMANILKAAKFDVATTLGRMGKRIEGQLVASIKALTSPPNAASTVRAKGFDKPLIGGANDSGGGGVMWNSVDSEVVDGK